MITMSKMEQEEAESNLKIMHEFLHCLRMQKLEELNEIHNDLQYIKEDIKAVERHRIELYRARERCSIKLRMISDDYNVKTSLMDKHGMLNIPEVHERKDACSGSDSQVGISVARKRRVHSQVSTLSKFGFHVGSERVFIRTF
ncbi:putative E3 ubiquitin-protein ligase COP1 [Helianthus debilis subsp. tardiflorus]